MGDEERREELLEYAEVLKRDGIPAEKIAARMVEKLPLSKSTIYDHLPDEYKSARGRPASDFPSSETNSSDENKESSNFSKKEGAIIADAIPVKDVTATSAEREASSKESWPSLSQNSPMPAASKMEPGAHIWDAHMPVVPVAETLLSQVGWQQAVYNQLGQAAFIKISQASGLLPKDIDINVLPDTKLTPAQMSEHLRQYVGHYTNALDRLIVVKDSAARLWELEGTIKREWIERDAETTLFKMKTNYWQKQAGWFEYLVDLAMSCMCPGDMREFTRRGLIAAHVAPAAAAKIFPEPTAPTTPENR